MYRSVGWLFLLLILPACREPRPESGAAKAPDVATADTAGIAGNVSGVEFEAPRLIPGVRAQIAEIEDPQGAEEPNVAPFRNGVGTLIDAMVADLNRVGVTDTGSFAALADSILRAFGGGASDLPDIAPDEARQLAPRVERLIGIYEERMRKAGN